MNITEHCKPWYKYPLLWMMLLIPFAAMVRGVWMIWISIVTADGLVTGDYYKQGRAINEVLTRDIRAAELGLRAVIEFDNSSSAVTLQFDKGLLEYYPRILNLHVEHATRARNDLTVLLHHGIDDRYIGYLTQKISEGIWYFGIDKEEWKLNARFHVRANNVITLQSRY